MSISNLTQCRAEISVCRAQSIALLLNGFFSLFGPGNSAAKWLLLETSTWKLWMATTALGNVMNATFVAAADAVLFISTNSVHSTLTFSIDSKIQMLFLWQKFELLRVRYDSPLFVFSVPRSIDCGQNEKAVIVDRQFFLLHICFSPELTGKD